MWDTSRLFFLSSFSCGIMSYMSNGYAAVRPGLSLRVLILEHYDNPGASLMVISTADPQRYDVWYIPMPWHSIAYPLETQLCTPLLPSGTRLDPHAFCRPIGQGCDGQPGKVLFVFSEKFDYVPHQTPYVDVWSYAPRDQVLLWTVVRYHGVGNPYYFWRSPIQEYIRTAYSLDGPLENFRWFVSQTRGLPTLRSLVGRSSL